MPPHVGEKQPKHRVRGLPRGGTCKRDLNIHPCLPGTGTPTGNPLWSTPLPGGQQGWLCQCQRKQAGPMGTSR